MGSLEEEEERLLQMVRDFIESSSSEPSPNFCSIQEKSTHLKHSIFNLQELLRKKTDVETEVLEKICKYMKGKREMKKTTSLKKWLVMCLRLDGLDASLCHTSWVTKPDCPCGNYEYIDIIVEEEGLQSQKTRLMIDIDFKSQFEVARPTPTYLQLSNTLPSIFVGNEKKLNRVISILCSAAETSLKESGLHIPPWRRVNYMQSKWLSDCCKKDPNNNNISNTKPCFCTSINIVGSSGSHDQGLDHATKKGMKFGKWAPPAVRKKKPQSKDIGGGGGGGGGGGNGGGSGLLSTQFSNMSINCC